MACENTQIINLHRASLIGGGYVFSVKPTVKTEVLTTNQL